MCFLSSCVSFEQTRVKEESVITDHVQASRRLYEDGWDSSVEARHETTEIPLRSACVSQHNNTRADSLCTLKQT